MPLYEYECRSCHHRFEALVRDGATRRCPKCDGEELGKLLSVFAVNAEGATRDSAPLPSPCGSCGDPRGPGGCRMN